MRTSNTFMASSFGKRMSCVGFLRDFEVKVRRPQQSHRMYSCTVAMVSESRAVIFNGHATVLLRACVCQYDRVRIEGRDLEAVQSLPEDASIEGRDFNGIATILTKASEWHNQ